MLSFNRLQNCVAKNKKLGLTVCESTIKKLGVELRPWFMRASITRFFKRLLQQARLTAIRLFAPLAPVVIYSKSA